MYQSSARSNTKVGYAKIVRICAALLCTFYTGFQLGYQHGMMSSQGGGGWEMLSLSRSLSSPDVLPSDYSHTNQKLYTERELMERVKHEVDLFAKLRIKKERRQEEALPSVSVTRQAQAQEQTQTQTQTHTDTRRHQQGERYLSSSTTRQSSTKNMLPKDTESFVAGMSLVDRDDFAQLFDVGVPIDASEATNRQVLLLHARHAMPTNANNSATNNSQNYNDGIRAYDSVDAAVQNCNYVNVILTEQHRDDQCIAIMGQYNSYHVHKFMRVPHEEDGPRRRRIQNQKPVVVDRNQPLRLVPRGTDTVHAFTTQFPQLHETRQYWNTTLRSYLNHLDSYLEDLRPILKRVALCKAVIVMVCNRGQSDLLSNFVCSARARGLLDVSGILVFATDPETHRLAQGLGLESYYSEQLFHSIPKDSAQTYGDPTYADAIVAKVFCVQLVSMLGYDILFQDVDVVWYQDPLEYFQSSAVTSKNYDIYMQHDGNRAQFYMPWAGNTGVYYVRNNPRTQYFLNHVLMSGDLIAATTTHQAPFLSLLSEHASLHGLKVKILPTDDYPGGYHFQGQPDYMRQLLEWKEMGIHNGKDTSNVTVGSTRERIFDPKIFHMSWTDNKDRKVQFLQQMGEWYAQNSTFCAASLEVATEGDAPSMPSAVANEALASKCCSLTPIIKCHFRDKPSAVPCVDSPNFKKGSPSFW